MYKNETLINYLSVCLSVCLLVPSVVTICMNACNDPTPHRRNVTQYQCVRQIPPFLL